MKHIETSFPFDGFHESRPGGRPDNQDYVDSCDTPYGLLVVVCDGMGGGPGGATASTEAVRAIIDFCNLVHDASISRRKVLIDAIKTANQHLLQLQKENPSLKGMGTTVTAFLANRESALLAHVGDSRIYQFRFGRMIFRTEDHSLVADLVRFGHMTEEEARIAPNSNVITRALGIKDVVEPSIIEMPYERNDRFVLCTDGVWNSMHARKLISILTSTKKTSATVEKAMISVDEIGIASMESYDNFTMAIVEAKQDSNLKEPMNHKFRNLLYLLTVFLLVSLVANLFQKLKINSLRNDNAGQTEVVEKVISDGRD